MNKKIEKYAVVDLSDRKIKTFADRAEAWKFWQHCALGTDTGMSVCRYTFGKEKNLKKYLNPLCPCPKIYTHDDLPSRM